MVDGHRGALRNVENLEASEAKETQENPTVLKISKSWVSSGISGSRLLDAPKLVGPFGQNSDLK